MEKASSHITRTGIAIIAAASHVSCTNLRIEDNGSLTTDDRILLESPANMATPDLGHVSRATEQDWHGHGRKKVYTTRIWGPDRHMEHHVWLYPAGSDKVLSDPFIPSKTKRIILSKDGIKFIPKNPRRSGRRSS